MQAVIPHFHLPLTAASGQCFRFNQMEDGSFHLVAGGKSLRIEEMGGDSYRFSCDEEEFNLIWSSYFDLERDYGEVHRLVLKEDSYLQQAIAYASGVRILRQEPFETLISFIISQRKSIPSIKACVENLCLRFGKPLTEGIYSFPEPVALANADEQALKDCGLGYRVPYIKKTARMVAEGQVDLNEIASLKDEDLEERLLLFPGVGKKVAACVMLFSYGRMGIFPVDTWIQKVLDSQYQDGFPYEQYKGVTGILQQYLFCYARHLAGRGPKG